MHGRERQRQTESERAREKEGRGVNPGFRVVTHPQRVEPDREPGSQERAGSPSLQLSPDTLNSGILNVESLNLDGKKIILFSLISS